MDDEPNFTFSINMILKDFGFVIDAFNDPLLSLSYFKIGIYTPAIIDIKMPKMNDYELSEEIRKLDNNIKISFITTFDIQEKNLKPTIPILNNEKLRNIRKLLSIDVLHQE
ncbi:MAG: response regulator [Thermoproteota archaeon]|nr:response regulator [Thermoproteota archaeon]